MLKIDFHKLDQNSPHFNSQREQVFHSIQEEIYNVIVNLNKELEFQSNHQLLGAIQDLAKRSLVEEEFEYKGDSAGVNNDGQMTHTFNKKLESSQDQAVSFKVSLFEKLKKNEEYELVYSHPLRLSFQRKLGLWVNHSVINVPVICFTHQVGYPENETDTFSQNQLIIKGEASFHNRILFGVNPEENLYCNYSVPLLPDARRSFKVCLSEFQHVRRFENDSNG